MNKKHSIIGLFVLLLLYPAISVLMLSQEFEIGSSPERLGGLLSSYRISLWLSWVVMACLAVFYKWTTGKNFFSILSISFLALASAFLVTILKAWLIFLTFHHLLVMLIRWVSWLEFKILLYRQSLLAFYRQACGGLPEGGIDPEQLIKFYER